MVVEANPKQRRLMEVAASVLAHTPAKKLKTVVLNQALFYIDLVSLRDFGDTVSHNTYIAVDHGPVIAQYPQRLITELIQKGIAIECAEERAKPILLQHLPDRLEYIDDAIEGVIQKIAVWASHQTSEHIAQLAQQNLGWLIAYQAGVGSKQPPQPINLHLAMQQIVDHDPWMDMDYTVAEQAILAADHDWGVPW